MSIPTHEVILSSKSLEDNLTSVAPDAGPASEETEADPASEVLKVEPASKALRSALILRPNPENPTIRSMV